MDSDSSEGTGALKARLAALEKRVEVLEARGALAPPSKRPKAERKRGGRFARGTGPSPDGSTEAARLVASKMVLGGRTSKEIADHLRETYGIKDVDELLEEVGASAK